MNADGRVYLKIPLEKINDSSNGVVAVAARTLSGVELSEQRFAERTFVLFIR